MGFLIEVFWALLLVGVPVGIFTLALFWWALQGGHFKESLDSNALRREIKAMSGRKKKKTKEDKKKEDKNSIRSRNNGPNLVEGFTESLHFLRISSWKCSRLSR